MIAGQGAVAPARLRMLVRLGLGGKVGSGTQGMSWIHELDMNRLFERALTDGAMQGRGFRTMVLNFDFQILARFGGLVRTVTLSVLNAGTRS